VLGVDGAGRVAAVGPRVRRLKVGDKVYSYSWANRKGGFYAEYVAVAAENVSHIPKPLDLYHSGAIATTGLTVPNTMISSDICSICEGNEVETYVE
jgi:NADPH2:quinone reductase